MTRILVCGSGDFEDRSFVHNSLNEIHKIYGPITCVVHNNHPQALAWQQWISRRERVLHMPITENPRDGVAAGERCRDRMFIEGRPDYVIVFAPLDAESINVITNEKRSKVDYIRYRAHNDGIEVLFYIFDPVVERVKRLAKEAEDKAARLAMKEKKAAARVLREQV